MLFPPCHVTERDHSIAPHAAALLRHQNAATLPYQWTYYSRACSAHPINIVTNTTKLLESCLTVCNCVTYSLFWGNRAKNPSMLLWWLSQTTGATVKKFTYFYQCISQSLVGFPVGISKPYLHPPSASTLACLLQASGRSHPRSRLRQQHLL